MSRPAPTHPNTDEGNTPMTQQTSTGPIEGTGGFAAAWLAPGDETYSGYTIGRGRFGLRLHGTDTELTGTPAELGAFADRMAARWVSPRVDAFNVFADRLSRVLERGFTGFPQDLSCGDADAFALVLAVHGAYDEAAMLIAIHCDVDVSDEEHSHIRGLVEAADIAAGEASANGEIAKADYAEADAAAHDYVQTLLDGAQTGSERAQLKAQFLAAAAEARQLDAEADRLAEEADKDGTTNREHEVRDEAGQAARTALAFAEQLLG
jgi:hypothetical protein